MKILPLAMVCVVSACTGVIGGSPGEAGGGVDSGGGGLPIDSGTPDGDSPDSHAGTSSDGGAAHDAAMHDAAGGGGDSGDDGGAPLVPAPLTGNVSPGTWQYIDIASPGFPQGKMHAGLLLPSGYAAAYRYPVIVYEHQNSEGDAWYQQGGDPTQNTIVNQDVIDGFFNSVSYRTDHPSIVLVPFCDQTIDPSGSNGDSNFGGYGDSPGSSHNENGVVAVVQYVEATFSAYPAKTYVTGQSLGGIGTWALLLDHNQLHGALSRTFTAGAPLSGGLTRPSVTGTGPGGVLDASSVALLSGVPIWAINGQQDTWQGDPASSGDSVGRPLWRAITGGAVFPVDQNTPPSTQAGASPYHYDDAITGHNTWNGNTAGSNYGLYPDDAKPWVDWLFQQGS
jgi:hypothetical protein